VGKETKITLVFGGEGKGTSNLGTRVEAKGLGGEGQLSETGGRLGRGVMQSIWVACGEKTERLNLAGGLMHGGTTQSNSGEGGGCAGARVQLVIKTHRLVWCWAVMGGGRSG